LKSDFPKKIQNGQFNVADIYFKKCFNFYEKYLGVFSFSDYKSEYNPNLNSDYK